MAGGACRKFLKTPVAEWKTRQVIGVDWYDGWRMVFVMFDEPYASLVFELIGYGTTQETGSLFKLYEFPDVLFLSLESLLKTEAKARGEEDDEVLFFYVDSPHQEELERLYQEILSARVLLPLLAQSTSYYSYDKLSKLWEVLSPW